MIVWAWAYLIGIPLFVFVYVRCVLWPVIRLLRNDSEELVRGRFSMTDLLALMTLIALPVVLVNVMTGGAGTQSPSVGILMFVGAIVWFASLTAVNHIGVQSQWKRLVGIGFTFPFALLAGCYFLRLMTEWLGVVSGESEYSRRLAWSTAAFCLTTLLLWASAKWVVRNDSPRKAELSRIGGLSEFGGFGHNSKEIDSAMDGGE